MPCVNSGVTGLQSIWNRIITSYFAAGFTGTLAVVERRMPGERDAVLSPGATT